MQDLHANQGSQCNRKPSTAKEVSRIFTQYNQMQQPPFSVSALLEMALELAGDPVDGVHNKAFTSQREHCTALQRYSPRSCQCIVRSAHRIGAALWLVFARLCVSSAAAVAAVQHVVYSRQVCWCLLQRKAMHSSTLQSFV